MIPRRVLGGRRLPLADEGGEVGAITLIERAGELLGGRLERLDSEPPRWTLPGSAMVSFEPGGQLEVSTEPFPSVGAVIEALESVLRPVHRAAGELGIELVTRGVDPAGRGETPLLILNERYRKQRAHYDAIGPWGRRMMGESAAIHVNVDLGGRPIRRWRVAQRAAPYLTALFANSPGSLDGASFRSVRAGVWRRVDPSRTGLVAEQGDPMDDYLDFALRARDFLGPDEGAPTLPFRDSWDSGAPLSDWSAHLGTLFPEVRPRGYLEIRSIDALRPAWYAVPATVLVGLLYDPAVLTEAESLLGPADDGLLERAGRLGIGDSEIRATACDLFELGLRGAVSLGSGVVDPASLETTRAFYDSFTRAGLDPGHEAGSIDPFAR